MVTQKNTVITERDKKPQTEQQVYHRLHVLLCCSIHVTYKLHHESLGYVAITTPRTLSGTQL